MNQKDTYFMVLQTMLAIFGVLVGYPKLGNIFIIIAAPFVLLMIIRKNAIFLPALILHCSSQTSIIYLVSFSVIILTIVNYKKISQNRNILILFWLLILTLPLFVILTYQKMAFEGLRWQTALNYTGYYLSFWSFIYGYIISNTFNWKVVKSLIITLLLLFIISLISSSIPSSRIYSMVLYMGIPYGLFTLHNTSKKVLGLSIIVISSIMLFGDRFLTFTEILTILISIIVYLLWNMKVRKFAKKIISLPAFIVIAVIMVTSINNYSSMNVDYTEYGDYENSRTFDNIYNRALYKLYDDRAVFWVAAWEQIMYIKPIMPMHDIPDIIAYRNDGNELDASAFGAHNTPLQLIRIFGILMGTILIICYIYTTYLSSNIILCKNIEKKSIPLFITIISYVIVIFMTGTAIMLPQFSLFYFGIMGIAYNKSLELTNK